MDEVEISQERSDTPEIIESIEETAEKTCVDVDDILNESHEEVRDVVKDDGEDENSDATIWGGCCSIWKDDPERNIFKDARIRETPSLYWGPS